MTNLLFDTLFGKHAGSPTPFLHLPDGTTMTYDAFLRRTAQMARALTRSGVAPGDRVAAQIRKSPDALVLYAACVQSGAVFLPLNTGYTATELDYFVTDSGARLLVCDPSDEAALSGIATANGATLLSLSDAGGGSLRALADGCPESFDTVPRDADDLCALLYTSGTTGRSKGAMLSQRNLLSNAEVLTDLWAFTPKDVLLHALPVFHTHGLFVAVNITLAAGGSMIFLPGFDVDDLIARLPRATTLMGVPTFYTRLLEDPRFTERTAAHMRLLISGSAPLLAETHARFEALTGHRILERYGMTETNMNSSNPCSGERRAGTVGFPLPGTEIVIRDPDTGQPVPAGEIGGIEVRGPNVFQGYWKMPEKTAEELRPDGFFVTGDLGLFDPDGYLTIVGRSKDLVISGGYNIYPKEVELALDEQPGVLESAVIGVPHPDLGEAVVGVLVPAPGQDIDTGAVMAALAGRLARYKQPRRLELVETLPRNTMGKVQKNLLRELFADSFA
ncbi:malonate--CoA ligase [Roseisalinus antarcticus]|uniref:Long-chain-fatty-acid--CoA ligase n=1 Tax=Roseisalinus antarcticus TaxID=254357 RepID=A0A1Y5TKV8_9RHOB|nr:malonyl-CoA synthase [Roseisalinus antarcticus]SLN65958.1 Long-chain-fatty-acid--CoA ligase [Roseisalinus antarcticus]